METTDQDDPREGRARDFPLGSWGLVVSGHPDLYSVLLPDGWTLYTADQGDDRIYSFLVLDNHTPGTVEHDLVRCDLGDTDMMPHWARVFVADYLMTLYPVDMVEKCMKSWPW